MLTEKNLKAVFDNFDEDGDGKVTRDEILKTLDKMKKIDISNQGHIVDQYV